MLKGGTSVDSVLKTINSELAWWEEIIRKKEKALKKAPEGRLRVSTGHNRKQYYCVKETGDTSGVYLSKKKEKLTAALAQKAYDRSVLKEAEKRRELLLRMKNIWPEERLDRIYEELPSSRRRFVTPVTPSDEVFIKQWLEKPYEKTEYKMDDREFITNNGERVRSKSEIMIANRLLERGIPYKYECKLVLPDSTVLLPDFTILNVRRREEQYYEHFGMMDDEDYVNRNLLKVRTYQRNGIMLGDLLFLTFETEQLPFNVRDLDLLIDKCFT